MHLKQPSFTYSARWAYTKNKKEYKSLKKKTGDSRYSYQNNFF